MLTPITKLQAINIVLSNAQLSPVESLSSGDIDAEIAESVLDETTVEVQSKGWAWNTEEMKLTPTSDGYLTLPANTLEADAVDRSIRVVQRGNRLYDLDNNTFIFNKSMEARLVMALEFPDLPQSVRRYLALKSSRVFQSRTMGDGTLHQFIMLEEQAAWAELIKSDIRVKDRNHIKGGPVSARMQHRIRPRGRR